LAQKWRRGALTLVSNICQKQSNTLLYVEEWASRDPFVKNLDAVKLKTIVAAIELLIEAPAGSR